jgi:hypothetical protein
VYILRSGCTLPLSHVPESDGLNRPASTSQFYPDAALLATMLTSWFTLLLGVPKPAVLEAGGIQKIFAPSAHNSHDDVHHGHGVDDAIFQALELHEDPVDALLYLQPDRASELCKPRLLHIKGEGQPQWLTEGEKLRLRRLGKKFMDITDHIDFYEQERDLSGRNEACESLVGMNLI